MESSIVKALFSFRIFYNDREHFLFFTSDLSFKAKNHFTEFRIHIVEASIDA